MPTPGNIVAVGHRICRTPSGSVARYDSSGKASCIPGCGSGTGCTGFIRVVPCSCSPTNPPTIPPFNNPNPIYLRCEDYLALLAVASCPWVMIPEIFNTFGVPACGWPDPRQIVPSLPANAILMSILPGGAGDGGCCRCCGGAPGFPQCRRLDELCSKELWTGAIVPIPGPLGCDSPVTVVSDVQQCKRCCGVGSVVSGIYVYSHPGAIEILSGSQTMGSGGHWKYTINGATVLEGDFGLNDFNCRPELFIQEMREWSIFGCPGANLIGWVGSYIRGQYKWTINLARFGNETFTSEVNLAPSIGACGPSCDGSGSIPPGSRRGACCNDDGSCQNTTFSQCQAQSGHWQGLGTICINGECPGGACCDPKGFCTVVSPAQCQGFWFGQGTTCGNGRDGNQVGCLGGCCVNGQCTFVNLLQCALMGGIWMGYGYNCNQPTPCVVHPDSVPASKLLVPRRPSLWVPSRELVAASSGSGCSGCGSDGGL